MSTHRLDNLLRSIPRTPSRRDIARALAGFALAGIPVLLPGFAEIDAKRNKKKKRHRKKRRKKKECPVGQIRVGDQCVDCPTQCCRDADCTEAEGGICQANGFCQYPCIATGQPCSSLANCCDPNAHCDSSVCGICITEGNECDPSGLHCCDGGSCMEVGEATYECFV